LLGLLTSAAASAQVTLQTLQGDPNGNTKNQFGYSVACIGDVDGDQVLDFVVGAPKWATGNCSGNAHYERGYASVVSGLDGALLRQHFGTNYGCTPFYYTPGGGSRLGISVAAPGDVDGDGVGDYLIGSDRDNPNGADSGSATLFSGATGAVVMKLDGLDAGDYFGQFVGGAGDVDDDGVPDMIVAAPYDDEPLLTDCGSLRAVSGASGSTITTIHGTSNGALMGACGRIGDVNGDGHDDLLVGASGENSSSLLGSGRVSVYSGAPPHSLLLVFEGTASSEKLGHRVAGAGDLNQDGYADLLATSGAQPRVVHVFDAFGATLLDIPEPPNSVSFGDSLAGVGDVDGNGRGDFIVGDPGFNGGTGIAYVYSLKANGSLRLVATLPGYGSEPGGKFGFSAAGIGHWESASTSWVGGDFNGDGLDDAVVGATEEYFGRGRVSILSGVCLDPISFCTSVPNSSGLPGLIGSQGSLAVGNDDLVLTASQLPPDNWGLFFFGSLQIQTPFGCGNKCVGGNTHRMQPVFKTAPDGTALHVVDYAQHPELAPGTTWNFQLWFRDPSACLAGTNFTDGLSGTFCP
jgi:hypothetical protein